MTRSNTDIWASIVGCVSLLLLMCYAIYDKDATANLGLILPIITFLAGYIFHQNINEWAIRSLNDDSSLNNKRKMKGGYR